MKNKTGHYKLKRTLGLWELCFYGIGIILGAGIYALIGVGAGIAGNAIWISFVIGAILAAFTGLSYAELSSMYPKEAAEYNYTKKAFGRQSLSFIIGWLMAVASVIAAVTVAFGFAGYFTYLVGGSIPLVAAVFILLLSLLNYWGMKESARFNIISTIIEMGGLIIVILVGSLFFLSSGIAIDPFETPGNLGLSAILAGTAIIFFAFLGFEDIVNVSEEAKNARKNVPKALIIAIIVSTILYILTSFSAVNILGWEKLAASKAPLSEAVGSVIPNSGFIFSLIALFATANTALILLIVGSRILYGMACDNALPRKFCIISSRGTPLYSIALVAIAGIVLSFIGDIKTVAAITDITLFIIYFAVNASLIALRYTMPGFKRGFTVPVSIGRFPVIPFLGLLSSLFMLFYFETSIVIMEIALIAAGYIAYKIASSISRGSKP